MIYAIMMKACSEGLSMTDKPDYKITFRNYKQYKSHAATLSYWDQLRIVPENIYNKADLPIKEAAN